jgi:MFS transporter, ACS family, aldohexuronate transporter
VYGKATLPAPERPTRFRWVICGLIFLATTVNYVDRQVLGILAPVLQKEIGWSEIEYGNIVFAFSLAYAIGLLLSGPVLDRVGTRLGYAAALVFWSVAAMAHGLARTPLSFGVARFGLGLSEAANFPAAIKSVAEWFPRRERAFATGVFNSGTNIGAIVAPLVVPPLALAYGWPAAFLFTGAIGLLWLVLWLPLYGSPETHPRVSPAELALIRSDPEETTAKIPWLRLLPHRQTWAFALGKFLTDPIWWFYLYWIPKFLYDRHGIKLTEIGLPLVAIYLIADVGSIGGGWLSSRLIKSGWSVNAARKTTMLICAVLVTPIVFATQVKDVWSAVALIGLAAAAHQGFSANIFTLVSDMFPKQAVGSVVGIGGMAGAVGGMVIAAGVGRILQWTGSYVVPFAIAAGAYLVALAVIQTLAPRLESPSL